MNDSANILIVHHSLKHTRLVRIRLDVRNADIQLNALIYRPIIISIRRLDRVLVVDVSMSCRLLVQAASVFLKLMLLSFLNEVIAHIYVVRAHVLEPHVHDEYDVALHVD